MRLVPTGDKLIVRREESETMSSGGILLPDAAQEKSRFGRVLSTGDGMLLSNGQRRAPEVAEGDRILFGPWVGSEINIGGESLLILSESDILAIVR
ncbi:MAG: co-chaperone GroES [Thermoguttaceae bacterium]|nr:co-chaperone GroES [Thermoguttaceae bacterium]